jgi:hypothetical protein
VLPLTAKLSAGNITKLYAYVLCTFQKSTAFTRTFELKESSGDFVLRAESAFGRSFRLEHSGDVIATMIPDHLFTRRASIEILTQKWDFTTVSFSFWLVALTWRRAAQSSSAGGGAG